MSKCDEEDDSKTVPNASLTEALFNKNRLFLFGEIDADSVLNTIQQLELLKLKTKKDDNIILFINSHGGDATAALALIDQIQISPIKIISVIMGEAASAAALISIACHGRVITPNSWWMQHSTLYTVGWLEPNKIKQRTKFIDDFEDHMNNILKKYTKLTDKDIQEISTGEMWLNAEQCLEKGIADLILSKEHLMKEPKKGRKNK